MGEAKADIGYFQIQMVWLLRCAYDCSCARFSRLGSGRLQLDLSSMLHAGKWQYKRDLITLTRQAHRSHNRV